MSEAAAAMPGRCGAHVLEMRVYYEDTDAGGVVYHAAYLRFAERARTELMRALGFDHAGLRERDGLAFAVRRCEAEFLRPARLDDLVEVHTLLAGASAARLRFAQTVRRGGDVLVEMKLQIVCLRPDGRPARIPDRLRRAARRAPAAD